jgi:recombination protein RecR
MNFSNKLIEDAVDSFTTLPGIGKKSALRLVLHLLKKPTEDVAHFGNSIINMRNNIRFCESCYYLSDNVICEICSNTTRKQNCICIVESIRDVIAIENTQQYSGLYHVLGGVISPVDGIGPEKLTIDKLIDRVSSGNITELIMAVSPSFEGDTTIYYISKKLAHLPIKITSIARGVSFGGELQYVDDLTLGRSISSRVPYETLTNK